jgi:hypothetical protein
MNAASRLAKKAAPQDPAFGKRRLMALGMISLMVGASEALGEKDVIFPEMAALTIGFWVVGERLWVARSFQSVASLTLAAFFGFALVQYSPFHLLANLALAFSFGALCLWATGSTMYPLISACVLPVLIHTENWTYPVAVLIMSSMVAFGRALMEKIGWRAKSPPAPLAIPAKKALARWGALFLGVLPVMALAVLTSNRQFILPPLIVAYVELANSPLGRRTKPLEACLLLVAAAAAGSSLQALGHYRLGLPETLVAFLIAASVFAIFRLAGKCYPPAGAVSLIPLLLPRESLAWVPLRVAVGSGLLILISMVFFQKCHKWTKPQLIYCFAPNFAIKMLKTRKKAKKRSDAPARDGRGF